MSMVMGRAESYGFDRGGGGRIFTIDPAEKHGGGLVGGGSDPGLGRWLSPLGPSASVGAETASSSSSSSIGMNSDDEDDDGRTSSDGGDSGENEAESPYKGSLDMMDSLEEVLPIRRGVSRFYNGKSKSFTSLAEAALSSSSSMKDVAKPENPYSRRRRNLLSHHLWENKNNHRSSSRGGISKKPIMAGTSKSSLALAMAVAAEAAEMTNSGEELSSGSSQTTSGSPPRIRHLSMLPPLHPRSKGSFGNLAPSPENGEGLCVWRSYSAADFPRCFPAAASARSNDS